MSGVGPRKELITTRTLGPAGIELLYRTVGQVVRMRNVPPPPGEASWTADAITGAAHDIVTARTGPERFTLLASRSTDETSFRRQLYALVVNDLISAGRRTERGRLSERLTDVLSAMPDVVVDQGMVRTVGTANAGTGGFDAMVAAVARVGVVVPNWSVEARRNAPVADAQSLQDLVRAALSAAPPSGVDRSELVRVLAVRLDVHDIPQSAEHSVLERHLTTSHEGADVGAVASVDGERLLSSLTIEEQMVLPYLDETATEVAELTGIGRTRAWQTSQRLRLRLALLLQDDHVDARTVAAAAVVARQRWELP